ncbi:hypothetical protein QCA50_005161 [Cerrena zonata]|uniref:Uncharacterized protein n=1 Tax=Cerrena zonata TaxID=2478898 RepID=A0AAW0GKX8_9APHY
MYSRSRRRWIGTRFAKISAVELGPGFQHVSGMKVVRGSASNGLYTHWTELFTTCSYALPFRNLPNGLDSTPPSFIRVPNLHDESETPTLTRFPLDSTGSNIPLRLFAKRFKTIS